MARLRASFLRALGGLVQNRGGWPNSFSKSARFMMTFFTMLGTPLSGYDNCDSGFAPVGNSKGP